LIEPLVARLDVKNAESLFWNRREADMTDRCMDFRFQKTDTNKKKLGAVRRDDPIRGD
jgi:hypothetical protein